MSDQPKVTLMVVLASQDIVLWLVIILSPGLFVYHYYLIFFVLQVSLLVNITSPICKSNVPPDCDSGMVVTLPPPHPSYWHFRLVKCLKL